MTTNEPGAAPSDNNQTAPSRGMTSLSKSVFLERLGLARAMLPVPEVSDTTPPDLDQITELRQSMWQDGFRPVPIVSHDTPGPSPGKRPLGADWANAARMDPPHATTTPATSGAANTGILCDGLRVIDIDCDDPEDATTIRELAEGLFGPSPVRYRTNSSRITLVYRAAVGEPPKDKRIGAKHRPKNHPDGEFGQAVEVLGRGQQFVAHGIHDSGVILQWACDRAPGRGVSRDDLIDITEEQVADFLAGVELAIGIYQPPAKQEVDPPMQSGRPVPSDYPATTLEDVVAALVLIPPAEDYDEWFKIGIAVASVDAGPDGLAAWNNWSSGATSYSARGCADKWRECVNAKKVTFASLIYRAREAIGDPSWTPRRAAVVADTGTADVTGSRDGFVMSKGGLFVSVTKKVVEGKEVADGTEGEKALVWVAGPHRLIGECMSPDGVERGILIAWHDGISERSWIIPRSMLHGEGARIAEVLESRGLRCSIDSTRHLKRWLAGMPRGSLITAVERAGWHGASYILPDGEVYGVNDGTVTMRPELARHDPSTEAAGTLADWQHGIGRLAVGNSRVVVALSAALAGPLLDVAAMESGGLHFVGASSTGKSTTAYAAGSVWGRGDGSGQVRQWRATANGLEGVAKVSSDALLILDEIGQAPASALSDMVYMIGNGTGKQRAQRDGSAKAVSTWRLMMLSTGEKTISQRISAAGIIADAGIHVRLLDIPADAGAGLGIFENLHEFQSAAELADHIREAARTNYGTASRAFLAELARNRRDAPDELRAIIDATCDEFAAAFVPAKAVGQVQRAARRLGLIAAAGRLAAAWGVVPWSDDEAFNACGVAFTAWLSERGGTGQKEDQEALRQVRAYLLAHGETRFQTTKIDLNERPVINRAGWKRYTPKLEVEWLITPEAWAEICKGFDPKRVLEIGDREGWLARGEGRNLTTKVSIGGHGRMRVYIIRGCVLND